MFIRRKIKTLKGETYEQHQLLKSIRTAAGPRQEVVLNLGTLDLPKDQWKDLANAIEEKINNQCELSFFDHDEEVEKYADHFARMIISKAINQQRSDDEQSGEEPEPAKPEYETVDIRSIRTSESRSIGAEYIMIEQMKAYRFDGILSKIGFTQKQSDYAKQLIVGRAVHPSSERELARWINESSALKELVDSDERVYDNALHRSAILLWEHRKDIEKSLREKAKDIFSLDERIILYDLTNTYFEGSKTGSSIAQFGRSKEKRDDCKLATLALVVDAQGFPKESRILEGNISEPETFSDILESIKKLGDGLGKKTIVIDAGIATDANIELVRKADMHYVAISRKQSYDPSLWDKIEEKTALLADGKTKLTLKKAIMQGEDEDFKEALLLCHSPHKEKKEKQIVERRMKKFEEGLEQLNASLKKPRSSKLYSKLMERIGRLKEKYPVGLCFDIEVQIQGDLAREITFERNSKALAKQEKLGQYVIRTSRTDLEESDLSEIHRSLTTIESSFRAMKSDLGLRPNYHKNEKATIAHIFISVLAYHITCPILKRLSDAGVNHTWNSVRNLLSSHDRVVTVFNTKDQHCVHVRNTTTANMSQKVIYNALGIKHDPLKNISLKKKISSTQAKVVPKS